MDHLFSMDNIFFRTVGKLVDLIWVNILTLLCALPVVTAGASFSAMYYLLLRMAEDDQGALTRGFFRAFRENFKSATKVWLCDLGIMFVYLYNLYLLRQGILDGYGVVKKVSLVLIVAILFLTVMVSNYIFALLARYENGLRQTVKNAFLLSFAFFPRSLCMVVIMLFPLALTLLSDYFFWLWGLYGLAYPGYVIAMLMVAVFRKTEKGQREEEEEE